jgi:hypothetical protein
MWESHQWISGMENAGAGFGGSQSTAGVKQPVLIGVGN